MPIARLHDLWTTTKLPARNNILLCMGFALVVSLINGFSAIAAEIQLTTGTKVRFAEENEARADLQKVDGFITRLSPFDRAARMKTDRAVPQEEFLQFVSAQAQPWQSGEIERLTTIVGAVSGKLANLGLHFPAVINLIKTSGLEEGQAAYCRGNSIVLPVNLINGDNHSLESTVTHELFHIFSTNNSKQREALYGILGFKRCGEIVCPEELAQRKITNPDAPIAEHFIMVKNADKFAAVVPILYSSEMHYDCKKGGEFFNYMTFKLMVIEQQNGRWKPALQGAKLTLLGPTDVTGFREQIGSNTNYIIHPEEILADNFVLLVNEQNVSTPRIVNDMKKIFQVR